MSFHEPQSDSFSPFSGELSPYRTKSSFYRDYENGMLGNKLRSWKSISSLLESNYRGSVSVRCDLTGFPYGKYNVPQDEVESTCKRIIQNYANMGKRGLKVENFYFNESAPDWDLIVQGEIIPYIPETATRFPMHYSRWPLPMKPALKNYGLKSVGLKSKAIIDSAANWKSRIMLEELFEAYPQSVIEFGIYKNNLGIYQGYNTIIWEIRSY